MIKRKVAIKIIILILLQFVLIGCGQNRDVLKLNKDIAVAYNCEEGEKIKAEYYSLSDNSLHFVKIIMPDGKKYTLPQVVSGSGARYTDEREIEWWIKGDSAMIKRHTAEGDWVDIYHKCAVEK